MTKLAKSEIRGALVKTRYSKILGLSNLAINQLEKGSGSLVADYYEVFLPLKLDNKSTVDVKDLAGVYTALRPVLAITTADSEPRLTLHQGRVCLYVVGRTRLKPV